MPAPYRGRGRKERGGTTARARTRFTAVERQVGTPPGYYYNPPPGTTAWQGHGATPTIPAPPPAPRSGYSAAMRNRPQPVTNASLMNPRSILNTIPQNIGYIGGRPPATPAPPLQPTFPPGGNLYWAYPPGMGAFIPQLPLTSPNASYLPNTQPPRFGNVSPNWFPTPYGVNNQTYVPAQPAQTLYQPQVPNPNPAAGPPVKKSMTREEWIAEQGVRGGQPEGVLESPYAPPPAAQEVAYPYPYYDYGYGGGGGSYTYPNTPFAAYRPGYAARGVNAPSALQYRGAAQAIQQGGYNPNVYPARWNQLGISWRI